MLIRIHAHIVGPKVGGPRLTILPQVTLGTKNGVEEFRSDRKKQGCDIAGLAHFFFFFFSVHRAEHKILGAYRFEPVDGKKWLAGALLFTENDQQHATVWTQLQMARPTSAKTPLGLAYLVHDDRRRLKETPRHEVCTVYRFTLQAWS